MDRPYSPWATGLALIGLLLSCSPTLDTRCPDGRCLEEGLSGDVGPSDTMAAPPTLPDAPSTDTGCDGQPDGLCLEGGLNGDVGLTDTMAAPSTPPDASGADSGCVPLPETCDGFDQDCDGAIDNAPAPVVSDRIIDEGAVGGRGRPGLAWSTALNGYLISDMHEPQVGIGAACPAVVGVTRDGIVGELHTDLVGGTGGGCRNARFVPLSTARGRGVFHGVVASAPPEDVGRPPMPHLNQQSFDAAGAVVGAHLPVTLPALNDVIRLEHYALTSDAVGPVVVYELVRPVAVGEVGSEIYLSRARPNAASDESPLQIQASAPIVGEVSIAFLAGPPAGVDAYVVAYSVQQGSNEPTVGIVVVVAEDVFAVVPASSALGDALSPQVVALTGGAIVVYESERGGIFAARVDFGVDSAFEMPVKLYVGQASVHAPRAAATPDGGFVVVWEQDDPDGLRAYFQRFDAALEALTPPVRISDLTLVAGSLEVTVGPDGPAITYVESARQGQALRFVVGPIACPSR